MVDQTSTDREALQSHFAVHRALNRAPRLAWGVVRDGELSLHGGFDADEHTVFRIASMTKSFTAAAVLLLRDEGVFALDDPVTRYAPELAAIAPPTDDAPAITIRHLLTMHSGLATDDPWADRHLDFTDAQLDAEITNGALFAVDPGTAMQYSNLGYGLLGRVVLRATGHRVQHHITTRLLDPLGMHATKWSVGDYTAGTDIAIGHELIDDEPHPVPIVGDGTIAPMGGLFTTVADLGRWVTFLADGYPPRSGPDDGPLRRASRRELQQGSTMFAPQQRSALDGQRRIVQGGYGMGLMAIHHESVGTVVTHSGGLPGYGSNMRWVQGTRTGVIALANCTYARVADAAAAALDLLVARGVVEAPAVPVSSDLRDCCERLVALCNGWDDQLADALFSDNVAMDLPLARRRAAIDEIVQRFGLLRIARIEAMSAAEADIVVRGSDCDDAIHIEVQLGSQRPARVQWYAIVAGHD